MSICRGGRSLARVRHNLEVARLNEEEWRGRWEGARWFLSADGEATKPWGNETIRWHPDERWLEVKLPPALAHLANRPHGRYRLSVLVPFPYRGNEVAAQAASGAIRYDIFFRPERGRWYLDASWTIRPEPAGDLDELRRQRVLGIDLNADHLAAVVVDPSGNPVGRPVSVPLKLASLPYSTRDGRLRAAISTMLSVARAAGCRGGGDRRSRLQRIPGRRQGPPWPAALPRATGTGPAADFVGAAYGPVSGPPRPDGHKPGSGDGGGRPCLHLCLGRPALAWRHASSLARCHRPSQRGGSYRATGTWSASTATGRVCLEPTRGWATASYQLRRAVHTAQRRSDQAPYQGTREPQGPRAAAAAAQDPNCRPVSIGRPGGRRPFAAAHEVGLSPAECLGTVRVTCHPTAARKLRELPRPPLPDASLPG